MEAPNLTMSSEKVTAGGKGSYTRPPPHTHPLQMASLRGGTTQYSISGHYWGKATATVTYILDLVPSSRHLGKTPHKIRTRKKLDVTHLQPFGCTAYAKVSSKDGGSKVDARLVKAVLMGYFGHGDYKLLE